MHDVSILQLAVTKRIKGQPPEQVAKDLSVVSARTVRRAYSHFLKTGFVRPAVKRKKRSDALLQPQHSEQLRSIVEEEPTLFLDEYAQRLVQLCGLAKTPSVTTIHRAIQVTLLLAYFSGSCLSRSCVTASRHSLAVRMRCARCEVC